LKIVTPTTWEEGKRKGKEKGREKKKKEKEETAVQSRLITASACGIPF